MFIFFKNRKIKKLKIEITQKEFDLRIEKKMLECLKGKLESLKEKISNEIDYDISMKITNMERIIIHEEDTISGLGYELERLKFKLDTLQTDY